MHAFQKVASRYLRKQASTKTKSRCQPHEHRLERIGFPRSLELKPFHNSPSDGITFSRDFSFRTFFDHFISTVNTLTFDLNSLRKLEILPTTHLWSFSRNRGKFRKLISRWNVVVWSFRSRRSVKALLWILSTFRWSTQRKGNVYLYELMIRSFLMCTSQSPMKRPHFLPT